MVSQTARERGNSQSQPGKVCRQLLAGVLLSGALVVPCLASDSTELRTLALQQDLLSAQLRQVEKQMADFQQAGGADSVGHRKLETQKSELEQQLAELAERHNALLGIDGDTSADNQAAVDAATLADGEERAPVAMETKPLRKLPSVDAEQQEASQVAHLRRLLEQYDTNEDEASTNGTETEVVESREVAKEDAQRLARIPFSVDKVRLNGAEGSTALSQISQRLADPSIPESRRETAPILALKTRLDGKLIASEQRSLRPVGKYHYVTRLHLQPGETSITIQGDRWEISLPGDMSARDYLVTLYRPPGYSPEFHLFAVDDLLAEEDAHIPAWLPQELKLTRGAG